MRGLRVGVLLLASSLAFGCSDATASVGPVIPPTSSLDLGLITDAHTIVGGTLRVPNQSSETWRVESAKPTCSCVRIRSHSAEVPPGTPLEVAFDFSPRGLQGPVEQTVSVLFTGGARHVATVTGNVVPTAYPIPSALVLRGGEPAIDTVRIVVPGEDGRARVASHPADLDVELVSRSASNGTAVHTFAVARRSTAGAEDGNCLFDLDASVGATGPSALVLPILRQEASERLFPNRVVVVPERDPARAPLKLGFQPGVSLADPNELAFTFEPEGWWAAEPGTDGVLLTRLRESLGATVACRVSGRGFDEVLQLVPHQSSAP
ncbi:MAG: DUF1573 domain-containing protein [Planctomycetota bacterium]